jgi:hypothetical protein
MNFFIESRIDGSAGVAKIAKRGRKVSHADTIQDLVPLAIW